MDNFYCLVVSLRLLPIVSIYDLPLKISQAITLVPISILFHILLFVYLPSSPELEKTKTNIEKLQHTYSLFPQKWNLHASNSSYSTHILPIQSTIVFFSTDS